MLMTSITMTKIQNSPDRFVRTCIATRQALNFRLA